MTTAFSPNSNELPLATYTVESRYLEPSLTRTKIDFPWITAILPWVTPTLDNSKVFCFPLNHFYVILTSIYVLRSWHVEKNRKK